MKKILIIAAAAAILCGVLVYVYFNSLEERYEEVEARAQVVEAETTEPETEMETTEPETVFSEMIPDGMRAMTIVVDTQTGVGNYIETGDYVDVLQYRTDVTEISEEESSEDYILSDNGTKLGGSGMTGIVLEGVQVLAIGEEGYDRETSGSYSSITLAVSPEDSLRLWEALNSGGVFGVSLRTSGNNEKEYDGVKTFAEVWAREDER